MMTVRPSSTSATGLPDSMRTAQAAMYLPEVRRMLRRLSRYQLGICMPHMHDAATGDFQALAEGIVQVEAGLEVSFRPAQDIHAQPVRYLPVAWAWQAGAVKTVAACEMDKQGISSGARAYVKHQMVRQNCPPAGCADSPNQA